MGCASYSYPLDQNTCKVNSVAAKNALSVRVSQSNPAANQPIVVMPADGSVVNVSLWAVATNTFIPITYTWAQVKPEINSWATAGVAAFSATQTSTPNVSVALPKSGIYQFRVTAKSSDNRVVSSYVWVNAWESKTAIAPGNIGRNPGLTPPPSVRMLSADPGPFQHPRLLFTKGDWAELSKNSNPSAGIPESSDAVTALKASLATNFDLPGTKMNSLVVALNKFAASNYSSADYTAIASANSFQPTSTPPVAPELFTSGWIGNYPNLKFADALAAASYLAWLSVDPTKPAIVGSAGDLRLKQLATLTAAWSSFMLQTELANPAAFTGQNGTALANYSLALAYDLTYDAMTAAQQSVTRDYLYTIGNLYNTGGGGVSVNKTKSNPPSRAQNGVDFPNLADAFELSGLVIEGEETQVSSSIRSNIQYVSYVPAASSTDAAVTAITSWPDANQTSVRNLGRQVRANSEFLLSPWGFYQNMSIYFQLGQNTTASSEFAFAKRGENQWVTTNLYQALLHAFYNMAPKEAGGVMAVLDQHDSSGCAGGPGERSFYYISKFMFPDDPMIDFAYRQCTAGYGGNALIKAIFGAPLATNTLEQVAQAKQLALTKFDPFAGFAISRNGWKANDLNLVFNNFTLGGGHYHAQANSFMLNALGRVWASPPGYHVFAGDAQQQVLIQVDSQATDASEGYIGQGPSSYDYTGSPGSNPGTPFHGVLLDVLEDSNRQYTWFSGDAKPAYDFLNRSDKLVPSTAVSTGLTTNYMIIPGLTNALIPSDAIALTDPALFAKAFPYNPVNYAFRSILTVRGKDQYMPYVLIIDDIKKDGNPRNYRWSMNNSIGFGSSGGVFVDANKNSVYSSLLISPGATPTDAVLYHEIDAGTAPNLPRLLVRDVSEQPARNQPNITIDDRPILPGVTPTLASNLTYGVDNNSKKFSFFPSRRLFIDRNNVIEPKFKILLFPFGSGNALPITSWDATNTVLTVKVGNQTDTITFDSSNADHRTRLKSFSRK